jgi:CheY-like chemotaxis protein
MRLSDVLKGVIALADEMARAKGLRLTLNSAPEATQPLSPGERKSTEEIALPLDGTMVRQILLGLLSYLGEQFVEGEIVVSVRCEAQEQIVEIVGSGQKTAATTPHEREEQLATLYELAALQSAQLRPLATGISPQVTKEGFTLHLPRVPRRTVLLVDDNNDILELYQRYLQQREYRAISVQSGGEALRLASQLQPQAIVLDLMLPEQDGWEILQRLTNHPATQSIPVIICSILRARQLALALGAAAFLEKPVDETTLLTMLDKLIR